MKNYVTYDYKSGSTFSIEKRTFCSWTYALPVKRYPTFPEATATCNNLVSEIFCLVL